MKHINLPEQGYTPTNYKALVKLTKLSNADFYRTFAIPEQTFYKHRSGTRTMKWQEWQLLINAVKRHLTTSENDMDNILAQGTIYQLREKYSLENKASIEDVEQAIMNDMIRMGNVCNLSTTSKNNYYVIRVA